MSASNERITEVEALHECSLKILDEIGIRFGSEAALEIARKYGCRVSGEVVRISPAQVMELVGQAPSSFVLTAKDPAHSATIGGEGMEFLAGYGAPSVMDFDGVNRPAATRDFIDFIKMVEVHDLFNINGGLPVQPENLPPEFATVLMLAATLRHSRKALLVPNANGRELEMVLDTLDAWFGKDLDNQVCAMTLVNSLSPLQYDPHALENCIAYAQRGQALVVSGGALIGATGVLSLAGSFAQANAETLAGIAFAQMVRPGTPVVYGMMSSVSDMATGTAAIGCPEKALATQWNRRLADFYNLPCRAGGTDNDAQAVNAQAGMESMFTMGATMAAKTHLVIHAAGILAGYAAMSYEKFIMDLDVLGMLKAYSQGIQVNEETLALDIMKEVGIGGKYLTHPHTFAHCRDTVWPHRFGVRRSVKAVDAAEELKERALKEKGRLLGSYSVPDSAPEAQEMLNHVLKKYDLDYDLFF